MENNKLIEESVEVSLCLSKEEEKEYYLNLKKQLIKLLYLIEDEKKGNGSAELFFYGLIYELHSANTLCKNKLTRVYVKMSGLYTNLKYKEMSHEDIKRQIFECKGMVDYLFQQL